MFCIYASNISILTLESFRSADIRALFTAKIVTATIRQMISKPNKMAILFEVHFSIERKLDFFFILNISTPLNAVHFQLNILPLSKSKEATILADN